MGVVYKLKEEVIAFIIEQKKNNPSAGVRRLAVLTSEKFQIKVSKSSVNTVLKNAALSSSVGRRGVDGIKPEKFTIPPTKKKEISNNMQKLGFAKEKRRPSAKPRPPGEETKKQGAQKDSELPLMPDPLASRPAEETVIERISREQQFSRHVERLRGQKQNKRIAVPNGMGFVFLNAALWEVSSKSLTAEMFKKYVPGLLSEGLDAAGDLLMFLKFLGVETFDRVSGAREHGVWCLNNVQSEAGGEDKTLSTLNDLLQWHKTITESSASDIAVEYSLKKNHIFSEINGFKLSLEDGAELTVDADMFSFHNRSGFSLSSSDTFPVNKALAWLSKHLISNIDSPVFHTAPGETQFDPAFYDMAAALENLPGKKILKADVFDEHNQEIAGFTTIPAQKRTFLIGVEPKQKEFSPLTKNVKWAAKKPFYHEGAGRVVYYAQTKTDFMASQLKEGAGDFRVVTVWQDKQNKEKDPSWAILTNDGKKSGEEIVGAYLSRWPYLGRHKPGSSPAAASWAGGKEIGFSGIFSDLILMLNGHCRRHFFPQAHFKPDITQMVKDIYGIPGHFYETDDCMIVSLDVPGASALRKDMEYAVNRVNERHICDYRGRRLWLEI